MSCGWGLWPLLAVSSCSAAHVHSHPQASSNGEKAIDILKQRYAKGEINKQTYLEMKKDLEL
ncbi:MAG: SHOCT domain-containing protein [Candidatus Bathyarchaeota archaeon]